MKAQISMWTAAAMATLLVSCTTDVDPASSDETAQDETAAVAANPDVVVPGCRKVTASSIALYSSSTSYTVNCYFFAGDVFHYTGFSKAGGGMGRYESWCPRRAPAGPISWAMAYGTVQVACP